MKERSENGLISIPYFVALYWEPLQRILELAESVNPKFLLTIARKAPRLVELAIKYEIWQPHKVEIVSDRAIPFLPYSNGETVSVFDDVLIYGSTTRRVLNRILRKGYFPIPFVLARSKKLQKRFHLNAFYAIQLEEKNFSFFNYELVKAFRYLSKPYNVDHPLFYVELNSNITCKKDLLNVLKRNYMSSFYDITTPLENEIGILNVTILSWRKDFPRSYVLDFAEAFPKSVKVRLFINLKAKVATVEPICLTPIEVNEDRRKMYFSEEFSWADNFIRKIVDVLSVNEKNEYEKELATARLIMYIIEWIYGYAFVFDSELFSREKKNLLTELIRPFDLNLIFGSKIQRLFVEHIESSKNEIHEVMHSFIRSRGI